MQTTPNTLNCDIKPKTAKIDKLNKCLIKRNIGGIGDWLMLTPALKSLANKFDIYLEIPKKDYPVFENNPAISGILSTEMKDTDFIKIFDISDYEFNYEQVYQPTITKPKQELFANALKVDLESVVPVLKITKKEKKWAEKYLKPFENKKILVIAPKSANPTRDWPLDKWKTLINRIKKLNYTIIIANKTLNWDDEDLIFFNNQSLRNLFALVSKATFVISNDSGLSHIAAAFNIPSFTIFGPTDPKIRCVYPKSYFTRLDLPCSPCWYDRCDKLNCLKLLSVDKVELDLLRAINYEH